MANFFVKVANVLISREIRRTGTKIVYNRMLSTSNLVLTVHEQG